MNKNLDKKLLVIGIVIGLFIISLGGFTMWKMTQNAKPQQSLAPSDKPQVSMNPGKIEKPTESKDGIHIALMDASYYDSKKSLGFSFYVATLSVTSEAAININLSTFKTSEGISLDTVDKYVNTLEENQFYLGKENVVYQLVSLDKSSLFNIFVPVVENNDLSLTCDLDSSFKAELNPKMNPKNVNDLYYQANDVISDGKTYQLKVSEAFDSSGLYFTQNFNGNISEYLVPSTVSIFTFKLDVVSLFGDKIAIESATYISNKDSQVFTALDSSIQCEKFVNMIGQSIDDSGTGYLFFEAYNSPEHEVFYSGELHLKLVDNDNEVVVNVDLN